MVRLRDDDVPAGGFLVPLMLSPGLQAFEGMDSCISAAVLTHSQATSEGTAKQIQGLAAEQEDQLHYEQMQAQPCSAPVQDQQLCKPPSNASTITSQQMATPVTTSAPGSTSGGRAPARSLPTCMHVVPATPVLPCTVPTAPSTQPEDSLAMGGVLEKALEPQPGPSATHARLPLPTLHLDSAHVVCGQHCEQLSMSAGSGQACRTVQQMAAMSSQAELHLAAACSAAPSPAADSESGAEPFLTLTPSFWGAEVGANPMHLGEGLGADDDLFTAWHLGGYGAL